ncbi:MAG: hypothetical protein WCO23_02050 [bacterium]
MKTLAFKKIFECYEDWDAPKFLYDMICVVLIAIIFTAYIAVFHEAVYCENEICVSPWIFKILMGQLGYVILLVIFFVIVSYIKRQIWSFSEFNQFIRSWFTWGLLPYVLVAWLLTNTILVVGQSIVWIFANFGRILLVGSIVFGGAGVYRLVRAIFGF